MSQDHETDQSIYVVLNPLCLLYWRRACAYWAPGGTPE